MKKAILTTALGLTSAMAFFVPISRAATIDLQPDNSTAGSNASTQAQTLYSNNSLPHELGNANPLHTVRFYLQANSSGQSIKLTLFKATSNTNCAGAQTIVATSSPVTITTTAAYYDFVFTTSPVVSTTECYELYLDHANGTSGNFKAYGSSTDVHYGFGVYSDPPKDLYFIIADSAGITQTHSGPFTEYISPLDKSAEPDTNVNIQFRINDPDGDLPDHAYLTLIDQTSGGSASTVYSETIDLSTSFPQTYTRSFTLSSGHLYNFSVTPFLGTTFSDSTRWIDNGTSFSVVTAFGTTYENIFTNGIATSTIALCQKPSSILDVGNGISYALSALFVPSQQVVNDFKNLTITDKFPFQYVTLLSASLIGTSTSNSFATSTISLQSLNIGSSTPIGNILPDISFGKGSALKYLGVSNYNALLLMQGVAMYMTAFYYLFRRSSEFLKS